MKRLDGHGALTRRSFLRSILILGAGASAALVQACGQQAPAPPAAGGQPGAAQPSKPVLLTSTPLTVPAAQPTAAPAATPTQQAPAQAAGAAQPTATPKPAAAAPAKTDLVNNRVPLVRQQEAGPPKRGGILETSIAKDPETLEVMQSVNGPLRITSSLVYRRLVQFRGTDYYDIDVEPDMADSWT